MGQAIQPAIDADELMKQHNLRFCFLISLIKLNHPDIPLIYSISRHIIKYEFIPVLSSIIKNVNVKVIPGACTIRAKLFVKIYDIR